MSTNLRSAVAANVRAELARRRLRQADVAAALGMTTSALSRRLTGETPFDVDELEALAAHLELPITGLLPAVAGEVSA